MSTENNAGLDVDLGLQVDFGNQNLFELHHKALKEAGDGNAATIIPGADDGKQDDGKQDDGKQDDGKQGNSKPIVLDTSNVLDMAAAAMKNKAAGKPDGTAADDDNPADKKPNADGKGADTGKVIPEYFKTLYEHLTTNLNYKPLSDDDEFDGSPEKFQEWMETERQAQAETIAADMIEEAFINNPNNKGVAQDLFKFLQNGGKVADFVETRKYDDITAEYISTGATDDEKTERAKTVMSNYYTAIGWDKETIDKTIKTLETGGTLVTLAETTLPQFIKLNADRKAIADQSIKAKNQATQTQIKEYNTKLLDIIDKSEVLGTFEFKSPKEKQALKEFLFVPSVVLQGGQKVTPYIAALDEARKNPAFTLFQALVFKNKGVDLSKLEEKITNNTKQDLKTKLEKVLTGEKIEQATAGSSGGGNNNQRSNVASFLNFDDLQTVTR